MFARKPLPTKVVTATIFMRIEPIPHEPTRWVVYSESRPALAFIVDSDYYTARADGSRWACGCEQFMARGIECKHIAPVKCLTAPVSQNGV